jgi:hypothetical protein
VLFKLLYDILIGVPVTIGKQTMGGLRDKIDEERLITEGSIKERLQTLQLQLQDGDLTEDDYQVMEVQLIQRLKAVRDYRSQRE